MKLFIQILLFITALTIKSVNAEPIQFLTHSIKPFCYEEDGGIHGFAVDIVKEMMNLVGVQPEMKVVPFSRGLYTVQNYTNKALFIIARRPEREKTIKWVGPLVSSSVYFYKNKSTQFQVNQLSDLHDLTYIGVGRQNADHTYLEKLGFSNLFATNNQLVSLQMLALDRIDVTPMSELVMPELAQQSGIDINQIERTDVKLYDSILYLGFSNDTPDTEVDQWQGALDSLKLSGKYQTIKNNYLH